MKLPDVELAIVPQEKIEDYLLNRQHPDGAGKATFFAAQGFRSDQWPVLADALRRLAAENDVKSHMDSIHGRKYIIDGYLETPRGAAPWMRTVWIVDPDGTAPRLVTAYPYKKEDDHD